MATHMFDNFINEAEQPDNMHNKINPVHLIVDNDSIDEIFDKHGVITGYSWDYGNNVSIPLTINVTIKIKSTDKVSSTKGEEPTIMTPGSLGDRYYNTVDLRSWLLTKISNGYVWEEDEKVTFSSDGDKEITLTPQLDYLQIIATMCNFRGEEVVEQIFNTNNFYFTLSPDESKKIQKGIYTLYIKEASLEEEGLIINNPIRRAVSKYTLYVR